MEKIQDLFGKPLAIVNVGLNTLAESVAAQGVPVVDVHFNPSPYAVPRLT